MDNKINDQKGRDPEADTFFLGRSIILEDPEFNEQTVLHENFTLPTFESCQVNENLISRNPNRTDVAASEHWNLAVSNGFSAPIPDAGNDAQSTENLYEAVAVSEAPPTTNKTTIVLATFGIIAILAAVVVLGVCFSGDCGSKDNNKPPPPVTVPPTYSPISSPIAPPIDVLVEQVVYDFVRNITFSDRTELKVDGTTNAESRALTWIIQNDTLFSKSDLLSLNSNANDGEVSRRLRQRYPLYTLWFQQLDEAGDFVRPWKNTSGWLQRDNECEWFGILCENGYLFQVSFYDFATNEGNGFVGTIPPDIGLLSSLFIFSMGANNVTGTIPESIGNCAYMSVFAMTECSINGKIPSTLGLWTNMIAFDVTGNEITGMIPASIESWTNLVTFSLVGNSLTGSIPSFVGQWSQLQIFAVSANRLSNTIPEEIGNLVNLMNFAVSANELRGGLPSSIGRMTALTYFFVDQNGLTGTIPSSIGNWSLIKEAHFQSNSFSGTMPSEICASINIATDVLFGDCDVTVNCTCCTGCL